MKFTNVTGFPAAWTLGFERDGREMLVVLAKATYTLPLEGEPAARLAEEQVELVKADRFSGDAGLSAPVIETDFAHRKLHCDVILVGSAYAPRAEPVSQVSVGLKVGLMSKEFRVVGPRAWYKSALGVAATSPQPFAVTPISYDVAFGGIDRTHEEEGRIETFLANPVGKGYWRDHAHIDDQPLPNTEQLDRPVDDPGGNFAPMALSPIGRNWSPRLGYAGTYDAQWLENDAPFWPGDFDYRYFQAAPPDQLIPYPSGGEQVVLHNLTPDGQRTFLLPERRVPVTFIPHKGRDVTVQANLDTIVLEPDAERFTLTWRANLALGKSVFDVRETIIGEMSLAQQRDRRIAGKRYYHDLRELAAVRRRGGSA